MLPASGGLRSGMLFSTPMVVRTEKDPAPHVKVRTLRNSNTEAQTPLCSRGKGLGVGGSSLNWILSIPYLNPTQLTKGILLGLCS